MKRYRYSSDGCQFEVFSERPTVRLTKAAWFWAADDVPVPLYYTRGGWPLWAWVKLATSDRWVSIPRGYWENALEVISEMVHELHGEIDAHWAKRQRSAALKARRKLESS